MSQHQSQNVPSSPPGESDESLIPNTPPWFLGHIPPPALTLRWSGLTHPGKVRPNNEDAFLALNFDGGGLQFLGKVGSAPLSEADFVFAVSDGMGGAKSGEFASRIAVDKITQLLPRSFRRAAQGMSVDYHDVLPELITSIHRDLTKLAESYEECAGMGATLTMAWFAPGWMYFAHIGDSRLYYLPAGGALKQISEDNSHVGWLRRQGKINEREARTHPRKNVLNKALGAGHQFVDPQVGAVSCQPGDIFLLVTDGVTDGLWDRHLEEILRTPDAVITPAQQFINEGLARSGRDNLTAVVVEVLPFEP
ncbi:MAG: protein phosphatase 2C domain-containing protein [Verrucomicrobiota bacterium]